MIRTLLISCTLLLASTLCCQVTDTIPGKNLTEIVVTAFKEEAAILSPLNIEPIQISKETPRGNYNLTELISNHPGCNMLSTGVAIAKPVIRGLYGNRILVLLSGLKFDNQQWQEEHGLGLSDLGLERVELIKGPMSVLYGTEAVGGVINLIEEDKPEFIGKESDITIKLNSNTLGGLLQAGMKKNMGNKWFGLRAGIENNADYSDGNDERVLNSRFDGYYLKGMYGFQKKKWISQNHFMSSFNRFGFIFNDVYTFIDPDARWSRKLSENPAHFVLLNIFSSENKLYQDNGSILTLNGGVQSNLRMENEGGGKISLNMHLLTFQYLAKWEKEIRPGRRLILSNLGSFEDNTNYGARKIVPDANMQESNLSIYYEMETNDNLIFENGISVGEKWVKTYFTPSINGPDKEITPFSKFEPYWNVFSGISFFPGDHFNGKFNIATGVRIPNLAELSSDGLHEGVFTYEIGDPDLKNEQNIAFNALFHFSNGPYEFSVTPFYNLFYHYVYLTPTDEDWFGFPIFRYRQQDAHQFGTEATAAIQLTPAFTLGVNYSGMISKTEDGEYTPYLPGQKVVSSITWQNHHSLKRDLSIFLDVENHLQQLNIYPGEISTPSYYLVNAGISLRIKAQHSYELGLTAHNLLNETYYDHLSRFKYFGIKNIGRNVTLFVKAHFAKPSSH